MEGPSELPRACSGLPLNPHHGACCELRRRIPRSMTPHRGPTGRGSHHTDEYDGSQIAASTFHTYVPGNMIILVFALKGHWL
jgi:hypothetical protein